MTHLSPNLNEGLLIGDVGGTQARLGWMPRPNESICHIESLAVKDFQGPEDAIAHYLRLLAQRWGGSAPRPQQMSLAVATAVAGDRVTLTNASWKFSITQLQKTLGVQRLVVLNDFEALALSLPGLQAHQRRLWTPEAPSSQPGTLAVIGPGTGLGVAAVKWTGHHWLAISGEGGHVTLAAADDEEAEVLRAARSLCPHVSAERLISGIGLPLLHQAVGIALGQRQDAPCKPEQITAAGLAGDPVAQKTLDHFCAFLGTVAGNAALTFGARNGVYIGGGIAAHLGDRLMQSKFHQRFTQKGRLTPYLEAIPVALITDTMAALGGSALALTQST